MFSKQNRTFLSSQAKIKVVSGENQPSAKVLGPRVRHGAATNEVPAFWHNGAAYDPN
ncbi:hypothetical protein BF49_4048 [Bradyrhizobium sp.]|nr:hypothetical protein BF49_4048 [Bradyrhizobium sp.]